MKFINLFRSLGDVFDKNRWEHCMAVMDEDILAAEHSEGGNPPEEKKETERRKEPRYHATLPIHFRLKEQKEKGSAETADYSKSGVKLRLKGDWYLHADDFKTGQAIELRLSLPGSAGMFPVEGEIRWKRVVDVPNKGAVLELGVSFADIKKLKGGKKLSYYMADRICKKSLEEELLEEKNLRGRPVKSMEELFSASRLLYNEYRYRNYCPEKASKVHYHPLAFEPNSRTFIMGEARKILGTISLIGDGPKGVPSDAVYPEQVQMLRSQGRKVAEVGLLAVNREHFKKGSFVLMDARKHRTTFQLFKVMFDYARFIGGYDDLLIICHPKHRELYEFLTFEAIGPIQAYDGAQGNLALLMKMDIEASDPKSAPNKGLHSFFFDHPTDKAILQDSLAIKNPDSTKQLIESMGLQYPQY